MKNFNIYATLTSNSKDYKVQSEKLETGVDLT